MQLRNWISAAACGPLPASRDAPVLPVCSVNQRFPRETCLKLFRLSARSLEGNLTSADKRLRSPLSLLLRHTDADTSLTSCGQISLSTLSGFSTYRSIWSEYYGLSRRNVEEHLLCVCSPGPLLQPGWFGRVIVPVLTLVRPPASALYSR